NSASLLLPVSNLTNLLAFHASGLSFARFGGLMVLPWGLALVIEWLVFTRWFSGDLGHQAGGRERAPELELPVFGPCVPGATLAVFALSSAVGFAPVWVAAAGALVLQIRARPPVKELVLSIEPTLLVFVLGLGVVVAAAGQHGLSSAVTSILPGGQELPALL